MPASPWGRQAAAHHAHAALKFVEVSLRSRERQRQLSVLCSLCLYSAKHTEGRFMAEVAQSLYQPSRVSSVTTSFVAVVGSVREPGVSVGPAHSRLFLCRLEG